jgi:hypothetical protein
MMKRFSGERMSLLASTIWASSADASYTVDVYRDDELGSRHIQRKLPSQVRDVLLSGSAGERDTPEFYRNVDLGALTHEIELEGPVKELSDAIAAIKQDPTQGRLSKEAYEKELEQQALSALGLLSERAVAVALSAGGRKVEGDAAARKEEARSALQDPFVRQKALVRMTSVIKADQIKRVIESASWRIFRNDQKEEREAAFRTVAAVETQRDMATLCNIMLPVNGNWAHVTEHDGSLRHEGWLSSVWTAMAHPEEKSLTATSWSDAALTGWLFHDHGPMDQLTRGVAGAIVDQDGRAERNHDYEDRFLELAFPSSKDDPSNHFGALPPDEARTTILQMRKIGLLMRIMDASAAEQPKLIQLARAVDLADGQGRIVRNDLSFTAYRSWAQKMRALKDEGSRAVLSSRVNRLQQERLRTQDAVRAMDIAFELAALTKDAAESMN